MHAGADELSREGPSPMPAAALFKSSIPLNSIMLRLRTLLIPDIHQNYGFLESILEREPLDSFERIVLLGDYFDGREPTHRGPDAARKTARLINQLEVKVGSRLTLLWGNHDVPYYLYQCANGRGGADHSEFRRLRRQMGLAPESQATAEAICEEWPLSFWGKLRPFVRINRFVVSHAGIHLSLYPSKARSVAQALEILGKQWSEDFIKLRSGGIPGPLMDAGTVRGGERFEVGGVTWLDWEQEFEDDLPFGQIVGHSWCVSQREIGRSHCIDFGQCAYAMIDTNLVVRHILGGSS